MVVSTASEVLVQRLGEEAQVTELSLHIARLARAGIRNGTLLVSSSEGEMLLLRLGTDPGVIASFRADKQLRWCDADPSLEWMVAVDAAGRLHFLHAETGALQA